jgi:hypothetical protein
LWRDLAGWQFNAAHFLFFSKYSCVQLYAYTSIIEKEDPMNYLVQLKLANRPANSQEGVVFIEQFILPTLEHCKKLEAERKIVAGGPLSGAIALSFSPERGIGPGTGQPYQQPAGLAADGNDGYPALNV